MTGTLKQVINSIQLPINNKLTMVQLRAKAVQQLRMEPASSTPDELENGDVIEAQNVNSQSQ